MRQKAEEALRRLEGFPESGRTLLELPDLPYREVIVTRPEAPTGGGEVVSRTAPTKTHREMVEAWKRDPAFQAAYEERDTEYALLRELLQARQRAGLTQAEVAEKMGTKPPAVTRLETSLSDSRHSPTVATLKRYAQAVGCRLEVHLVPAKRS